MKKVVNGKVVDIRNIELFEKAQESLAIKKTTISVTSDKIGKDVDSSKVGNYIYLYNMFYKSMAYPLYAIEDDIKYATLGNFIKHIVGNEIKMWVDNGLYIVLDVDSMSVIHIVNDTWSIRNVDSIRKDNTDMSNFVDNIGYAEYTWLLRKVKSKDKDINFYKEFMGDFLSACNNNNMVISWELENMLTFASIPNQIDIEDNTILDISRNKKYTLDIYEDGSINTGEKVKSWALNGQGIRSSCESKRIKKYSYDLYEKVYNSDTETVSKNKKCLKDFGDTTYSSVNQMFNLLCGIKNARRAIRFEKFRGYKIDNTLIFEVCGNIYLDMCNGTEPTRIATQSELYSIKKNVVYFSRKTKVTESVNKVSIYLYNIKDEKVRLCKILFTY